MFKLAVVGGPAKGKLYVVKEGETSIGRVEGNDIVLNSTKVSKKHCVLVVNNSEVSVKDNGSSNGTFVNGVLTKTKVLRAGDRVSVGEHVLELVKVESKAASNVVALRPQGNISSMAQTPVTGAIQVGTSTSINVPGMAGASSAPKTLGEKIQFFFETYILNFVYNLNEKQEWKSLMIAMFVVLVVGSSLLSVYPVMDRVTQKLAIESERRAFLLARQIVDRNAPFIYEKMETKTDVSYIEREPGVQGVFLIDMDGRIMAPGRMLNQYLIVNDKQENSKIEATFAAVARDKFANRETLEFVSEVFGDTVGVAKPVKIFSAAAGKQVTVAVALVFFDRTLTMFDFGTEMMAYIQAIILSAILGVIIFFTLYRLTLRPLLALNDGVDLVLKGNATVVEKKFKMEEIDPLVDIVNAALQRAGGGSSSNASSGATIDDLVGLLRFGSERMTGTGLMLFSADKRVLHLNPFMEEITGIRKDQAVGSPIESVARDAAFVAFVNDFLARAPGLGQDPLGEDFEFSGTNYKMECVSYAMGGVAALYALTAQKV